MSHFAPGNLVLYKGRSAAVSAVGKEKIEIRCEGGDSKSVRTKDIVFLHAGPVQNLPPARLDTPDCEELLELMEQECFSFADFCELVYGKNSPQAAWSAWALIGENLYFTGSPENGVSARKPEEIAAALEARRRKEAEAEARSALLERIRNGCVTAEDHPHLREIEAVALGKAASSRLLKDLGIEADPVKAHELLLKLQVWSPWRDPLPDRAGIPMDAPEFAVPPLPEEIREDLTGMAAWAIDDAGSTDPDDAISFVDGVLWVHVADPVSVIEDGGEMDQEAMMRGANLYLPEAVVPMLPAEMTVRFGLGIAEISPALSFAIRIGEDGSAELLKMTRSLVKVTRLDYDGAIPMLENELAPVQEALLRFRKMRAENGALFIDLPEVKIRYVEETHEIRIKQLSLSPVRELVANAMLAAGHAVGKFMAEREIAMPFSIQPPPELPEDADPETMPGMFAMRRGCAPGELWTAPGLHSGLGLEPYVRLTSPLRRYEDILAHRQIRNFLDGVCVLSAEELDRRLTYASAAARERRMLEKRVNEFWTLCYLRDQENWQGKAVAVMRQEDRLTWLIPELAYEFKNRFGGDVQLGDVWNVAVQSADPAAAMCRMRLLEREEENAGE